MEDIDGLQICVVLKEVGSVIHVDAQVAGQFATCTTSPEIHGCCKKKKKEEGHAMNTHHSLSVVCLMVVLASWSIEF